MLSVMKKRGAAAAAQRLAEVEAVQAKRVAEEHRRSTQRRLAVQQAEEKKELFAKEVGRAGP